MQIIEKYLHRIFSVNNRLLIRLLIWVYCLSYKNSVKCEYPNDLLLNCL